MPAPLPRHPGTQYREIYGIAVFDCQALRASLPPEKCAENWRVNRLVACNGCPVGQCHSSQVSPQQPEKAPRQRRNLDVYAPCLRCGKSGRRLGGRIVCISCLNRTYEVLTARNRKGERPQKWPSLLHEAVATIEVSDPAAILRSLYRAEPCRAGESDVLAARHKSSRIRQGVRPLPRWHLLDGKHLWLECITTGSKEIKAIVNRLVPDGKIIEIEVGPSFAEQWKASLNSVVTA